MSEIPKWSRRDVLHALGTVAGLTAAALVGHRFHNKNLVEEAMDQQVPPVDHLPDGTPIFDKTAHILNWESLAESQGKAFEEMVERIKDQFTEPGYIYYHDLKGKRVSSDSMGSRPKEKSARLEWDNKNRKRQHGREGVVLPDDPDYSGYPFELPGRVGDLAGVKNRLKEEAQGPDYFKGSPKALLPAFTEIAKEYGVPLGILLGCGATESAFDKRVRDSKPKEGPPAKGIFQFLDWVAEAQAMPFLKEKTAYRDHKIVNYNPHNRFLQAECFCAHFLYLKEQTTLAVEKLAARMRQLDPHFNVDLSDLVALTAYNGGAELAAGAVDRFVALSDSQIKRRLVNGTNTKDVWLAVLAYNYGQGFPVTVDAEGKKEDRVIGSEVYHYPARIQAWKEMLS